MFSGRNGANEVYGSLAVLALGFADDVDVAARLVLYVADRFATAANDEADGAVGDKYLDRVLCAALVTFNINPQNLTPEKTSHENIGEKGGYKRNTALIHHYCCSCFHGN